MSSLHNANVQESLSVVIPAFNEEESIEKCVQEVSRLLEAERINFELIIVNDGSTDKTLELSLSMKNQFKLRVLNLENNAGHMAAITAGLEASRGKFVATMDADLQDPPECLIGMYKAIVQSYDQSGLNGGVDVVQGFRVDRSSDTKFKRISASLYYKIIGKIMGIELIPHAADFRIMSRECVDTLIKLPERNRIYRLLIPHLGFSIQPFPIVRAERFGGKTKYPLRKMIGLSLDSVFAFSFKPLRLFSYLGLLFSLFFLFGSIATLVTSLLVSTVPGWASVVLLLLSANSLLFAGLGLLGEYVGRVYQIVQARPIANWREV